MGQLHVRLRERDQLDRRKTRPVVCHPGGSQWFMRLAVMGAIVAELESLKLDYPKLSPEETAKLAEARKAPARS